MRIDQKQNNNPVANWKRPILGLSPMDGVTDLPFRLTVQKYGNPSVLFTEFISAEGIAHNAAKLVRDFAYEEVERPIIAQLFGSDPNAFYTATIAACSLGFDGIDINMGCPARSVEQRGGGAALITNPQNAVRIIQAVQRAVQDYKNGVDIDALELNAEMKILLAKAAEKHPNSREKERTVSVKTRIGYTKVEVQSWIPTLIETGIDFLTVHGRLFSHQCSGLVNWDAIGEAAILAHQSHTPILGNGGLVSRQDALDKIKTYGVDGALVGQAAFGNPWIFSDRSTPVSWEERKTVMLEHTALYEQYKKTVGFLGMRKHLGWYVKGIKKASELRQKLYQTNSLEEVETILKEY